MNITLSKSPFFYVVNVCGFHSFSGGVNCQKRRRLPLVVFNYLYSTNRSSFGSPGLQSQRHPIHPSPSMCPSTARHRHDQRSPDRHRVFAQPCELLINTRETRNNITPGIACGVHEDQQPRECSEHEGFYATSRFISRLLKSRCIIWRYYSVDETLRRLAAFSGMSLGRSLRSHLLVVGGWHGGRVSSDLIGHLKV